MNMLSLTLASARRINARAYNNVRLIKLADKIRRFDLEAVVNGDKVTVTYRNIDAGIVKVFGVTSFDQVYDNIPCQYCHVAKPTGRTHDSLVCEECYCENHGPCMSDTCKVCNWPL